MNHRTLVFAAAMAVAAALAAPTRAQNSQPAQPTPPAQSPAPATTQAPVQDTSAANNAQNTDSASQPAKAPAKKVWTDDDMNDLRSNSSISTVGGAKSNSSKPGVKPNAAPRNKTAQSYHDQITRLQAQIPPIDQKISDLQAALEGKPVSEARTYGWSKPGDWKSAIEDLQKQKAEIQTKIQTLQDQARHAGVPDNQIP